MIGQSVFTLRQLMPSLDHKHMHAWHLRLHILNGAVKETGILEPTFDEVRADAGAVDAVHPNRLRLDLQPDESRSDFVLYDAKDGESDEGRVLVRLAPQLVADVLDARLLAEIGAEKLK